jgi:YD repeat-containing protein
MSMGIVSRMDGRGIVTAYEYDELNRLIYKSYSDGTPAVSYFYDSQPSD